MPSDLPASATINHKLPVKVKKLLTSQRSNYGANYGDTLLNPRFLCSASRLLAGEKAPGAPDQMVVSISAGGTMTDWIAV